MEDASVLLLDSVSSKYIYFWPNISRSSIKFQTLPLIEHQIQARNFCKTSISRNWVKNFFYDKKNSKEINVSNQKSENEINIPLEKKDSSHKINLTTDPSKKKISDSANRLNERESELKNNDTFLDKSPNELDKSSVPLSNQSDENLDFSLNSPEVNVQSILEKALSSDHIEHTEKSKSKLKVGSVPLSNEIDLSNVLKNPQIVNQNSQIEHLLSSSNNHSYKKMRLEPPNNTNFANKNTNSMKAVLESSEFAPSIKFTQETDSKISGASSPPIENTDKSETMHPISKTSSPSNPENFNTFPTIEINSGLESEISTISNNAKKTDTASSDSGYTTFFNDKIYIPSSDITQNSDGIISASEETNYKINQNTIVNPYRTQENGETKKNENIENFSSETKDKISAMSILPESLSDALNNPFHESTNHSNIEIKDHKIDENSNSQSKNNSPKSTETSNSNRNSTIINETISKLKPSKKETILKKFDSVIQKIEKSKLIKYPNDTLNKLLLSTNEAIENVNNLNKLTTGKGILRKLQISFNFVTGYDRIAELKSSVVQRENEFSNARSELINTKKDFENVSEDRKKSQREINLLLQRKHIWDEADVSSFTSLHKKEYNLSRSEVELKSLVHQLEIKVETCYDNLVSSIQSRYHEEQTWSDKIRMISSYTTFAVLLVNITFLILAQLVFEPRRRQKIIDGVDERLKKESFVIQNSVNPQLSLEAVRGSSISKNSDQPIDYAFSNSSSEDIDPKLSTPINLNRPVDGDSGVILESILSKLNEIIISQNSNVPIGKPLQNNIDSTSNTLTENGSLALNTRGSDTSEYSEKDSRHPPGLADPSSYPNYEIKNNEISPNKINTDWRNILVPQNKDYYNTSEVIAYAAEASIIGCCLALLGVYFFKSL
ncbi:Sensitive to high expression protein 9, mitochondrial [Smittium mucronatum]|uniref:Sensitive to high expression protein 9, mitochondrial n=1 Tax=Smittium mucronatum TaxID=133383 RepID=A0A1R0GUJ9_9FUNG|nr:Sensitive to high expression protein 9, mitochondrial [Smittium mucronatum]